MVFNTAADSGLTLTQQKQRLRQQCRAARRDLTAEQQQQAAAAVTDQVMALVDECAANAAINIANVGVYLSNDGEVDLLPCIHALWQRGITTAVPVLHPFNDGCLLFLRYHQESQMTVNLYGIAEPKLEVTEVIPVAQLDLLLMPLVAFDDQGHRLGMGKGYYDRSLAGYAGGNTPGFVGVAHDCQQVNQLPTEEWDLPLDIIITPTLCLRPKA